MTDKIANKKKRVPKGPLPRRNPAGTGIGPSAGDRGSSAVSSGLMKLGVPLQETARAKDASRFRMMGYFIMMTQLEAGISQE